MQGMATDSLYPIDYHNLSGLNQLRKAAIANPQSQAAIQAAARQFESVFMNMLFASMRSANRIYENDDLFDTRYTQFYQDMMDKQLSADLSQHGSLGIGDLLVQHYQQDTQGTAEPSTQTKVNDYLLAQYRQITTPKSESAQENKTLTALLERLDKSHLGEVKRPEKPLEKTIETLSETVIAQPKPVVEKKPLFSSPQDFIEQILPLAKKSAQHSGLHPLAIVAQSALESGWGRQMMQRQDGKTANNLFGIKANGWSGEKVKARTIEFDEGGAKRVVSEFRAYQSLRESVEDFTRLITSSHRYTQAKKVAQEPEKYFEALQQAGYATDPQYADKLKRVFSTVKRIVSGLAGGVHGR